VALRSNHTVINALREKSIYYHIIFPEPKNLAVHRRSCCVIYNI